MFATIKVTAQGLERPLQLYVRMPASLQDIDQGQLSKLERKTLSLVSKNGFGGQNGTSSFVLVPSIEIFETSVVEGMRKITVVDGEFSMLIGLQNGDFFSNYSKRVRGSGSSRKSAITNLISKIPTSGTSIKAFFEEGKSKIKEHFESNCDILFQEVASLKATNQYNEALAKLWSVPSLASSCYEKANKAISETYKEQQDKNCDKYLALAKIAFAARDFAAATKALVGIDPESKCASEVTDLEKKIKDETDNLFERTWALRENIMLNRAELEKERMKAVSNIVAQQTVASDLNSLGLGGSGGGSGGGVKGDVNIINNANASSSSSTSTTEQPKRSATPAVKQARLKVISPVSIRQNGKVYTSKTSLNFYGFVENPELASTLSINKEEVSFGHDGLFNYSLELTAEESTVQLQLKRRNGSTDFKTIRIIQVEKDSQDQPESALVPPSEQKRYALVIGNGAYKYTSPLKNPINDAKDMSRALKDLNFEVTTVLDANYEKMRKSIIDMSEKVAVADVAVFYYAGHGVEVNGSNFLVPTDAKIQSPQDIEQYSLEVDRVLKAMKYANDTNLNILILDACRNNPFPTGGRGGAGLARVTPPSGMLIAYATEPGAVASDGAGENGLYTGELVKQMKVAQRIEDVFMNTRNNVEEKSNGGQQPWEEARLKGVFYLVADDE